MCLAHVILLHPDGSDESSICDNAARIDVDGDRITVTDLLERVVTVRGTLEHVDLAAGLVRIRDVSSRR